MTASPTRAAWEAWECVVLSGHLRTTCQLRWRSRALAVQVLATVLGSWGRSWFQYFPSPPMPLLGKVEELLALHDADLYGSLASGGSSLARLGVWRSACCPQAPLTR